MTDPTLSLKAELLYSKLVPPTCEPTTLHGVLIQAVVELEYEYLNNGNCNLQEFRKSITTNKSYQEYFDILISNNIDSAEKIQQVLEKEESSFSSLLVGLYNQMILHVVTLIETTEDKRLGW